MSAPAAPASSRQHTRPWGVELELADGSVWRRTTSGCWLVRLPAAYNTAALRQALRQRWPGAAAAWAPPPAGRRPPPATPLGAYLVARLCEDPPDDPDFARDLRVAYLRERAQAFGIWKEHP